MDKNAKIGLGALLALGTTVVIVAVTNQQQTSQTSSGGPVISQRMAQIIQADMEYGVNPKTDIAVEGAAEGLSGAQITAIQAYYG